MVVYGVFWHLLMVIDGGYGTFHGGLWYFGLAFSWWWLMVVYGVFHSCHGGFEGCFMIFYGVLAPCDGWFMGLYDAF